VLHALCEGAEAWWRQGRVKFGSRWEPQGLWGEYAMLAGALDAVRGGDRADAGAALGRYLARYPGSARANFLLGLWRAQAGDPPEEALAALRRATELDPGYLPAVLAAARLTAAQPAGDLAALEESYAEVAPNPDKLAVVRAYCRRLRAGQSPWPPAQ